MAIGCCPRQIRTASRTTGEVPFYYWTKLGRRKVASVQNRASPNRMFKSTNGGLKMHHTDLRRNRLYRRNARPPTGAISRANDDGSGTAVTGVPVNTMLSIKKSHPSVLARGVVMLSLVIGTGDVRVTVVKPELAADASGPIDNGSSTIPRAIPLTWYLSAKFCPLNNRKFHRRKLKRCRR